MTKPIIVGVDGSAVSIAALRCLFGVKVMETSCCPIRVRAAFGP
nr:hypothetical protein [Kibdelosporangium sp. MJ126-NF4]CEL19742.1 hypothetical protein [Kibdelosporangium sp. MJ126-NF4]CTQ96967.1 hypothetical protein [Kibdelosporangium sp. MJ126-NF4]